MKRPFGSLILGATLLSAPVALALSPADIPQDLPISQLLKSASTSLATGKAADALLYFDAAITRDPQNYLSFFKRGAAYLSLGKSAQAERDFSKVLELKPGFEGALLQRAKIRARNGEWDTAKKDYVDAGKSGGQELEELDQAQGASIMAHEASNKSNWDDCIAQSGIAIMVAGGQPDLRRLRANCRFEKGEIAEALSDLQHVIALGSSSTEPHMQISAMSFYSLGETDQGLAQIRKCLQSDPDSKDCRRLMKREKALDKGLKKLSQAVEKRQFATAAKLLIGKGTEEDPGLMKEAQDEYKQLQEDKTIHAKATNGLYARLLDQTCESYIEMNNYKRAAKYCADSLAINPTSLFGLLSRAKSQLEADDFQAALDTLGTAKEHHGNQQRIQQMQQEASTLLKRSKQKDYYKVLGVSRDADSKEIKRAYRKLTMQYHPDKAAVHGISKEEAEKKMASINEAYEVLEDPELKARFDRGDDPNDQESQRQHPFQGSPFGGGQQFFFQQGGGGGGFPGGSFQFQGGGFPGGFPFG